MKENNHYIDKIFKDDLKGYKEEPEEKLWAGIAAEIGYGTGVGTVGIALWKKVLIGAVVLTLVAGGIWLSQKESKNIEKNETKSEIEDIVGKSSDESKKVTNQEAGGISDKETIPKGIVQSDLPVATLGDDRIVKSGIEDQETNEFPIESTDEKPVGSVTDDINRQGNGPDLGSGLKDQGMLEISPLRLSLPLSPLPRFDGGIDGLATNFRYSQDSVSKRKRKWFGHVGLGYGYSPNNHFSFLQNEGRVGVVFGGGLYLSDQGFVSLSMSRFQWKLGYTRLIGKSKLKLAIEGAIGMAFYNNNGPSLGMGLFYDLKSGTRLTSMISYQQSLVGTRDWSFSANVGMQFDLFQQKNKSKGSSRRPLLRLGTNDPNYWKGWFITPQMSFTHRNYVGLGVGKYLNSYSFVEISAVMRGGHNLGQRTKNDRLRMALTYNYQMGQKKLKALFRAGFTYETSQKILNQSNTYYTIGFGALYNLNDRMNLFAVPVYQNPFSLFPSEGRFSVRLGFQLKL